MNITIIIRIPTCPHIDCGVSATFTSNCEYSEIGWVGGNIRIDSNLVFKRQERFIAAISMKNADRVVMFFLGVRFRIFSTTFGPLITL